MRLHMLDQWPQSAECLREIALLHSAIANHTEDPEFWLLLKKNRILVKDMSRNLNLVVKHRSKIYDT